MERCSARAKFALSIQFGTASLLNQELPFAEHYSCHFHTRLQDPGYKTPGLPALSVFSRNSLRMHSCAAPFAKSFLGGVPSAGLLSLELSCLAARSVCSRTRRPWCEVFLEGDATATAPKRTCKLGA